MIASIVSKQNLTLLDTITVSRYDIELDGDYGGKSQMIFHRKPIASEDDFILLQDAGLVFQGIINNIESTEGQNACTITAVEMQRLFDQKILLTNTNLLATGIEDFIANQMTENFISSDDSLLNISYLSVTTKTHTPVAAMTDNEDGVYNLCTYIGNALTNYGIFVDFEFKESTINVVIEKKEQPELKIDTGLANIINLYESYSTKVLAKLTVIWNNTKKQFFLKTDRTITENKSDPDRAKGSVDIFVSTAATEAEMRESTMNLFRENSYQHKITFDAIPAKLVSKSDLYVGHQLTVKTDSGIRDSIITGIRYSSGQAAISVTLGQMKVTLIEKLKGVEALK